jgi:hypothetical protein
MKKQATFYGTITGGRMVLQNPTLLAQFIKSFPDDSAIQVTVGKQYDDITRNQSGYYFGVIVPRGQTHFGLSSPQEMDHMFKVMFLTEYPDTEFERLKSKTELDVYEMSEFMERCILFLSQEGCTVEPSDRNWKMNRLKG